MCSRTTSRRGWRPRRPPAADRWRAAAAHGRHGASGARDGKVVTWKAIEVTRTRRIPGRLPGAGNALRESGTTTVDGEAPEIRAPPAVATRRRGHPAGPAPQGGRATGAFRGAGSCE